jgi:hypothetical protein
VTNVGRWPATPYHVLADVLAGAHSQRKTPSENSAIVAAFWATITGWGSERSGR